MKTTMDLAAIEAEALLCGAEDAETQLREWAETAEREDENADPAAARKDFARKSVAQDLGDAAVSAFSFSEHHGAGDAVREAWVRGYEAGSRKTYREEFDA